MRHGLHTERLTAGGDRSAVETIASATTMERPNLRSLADEDGTVAVLFSDIEGFAAMSERLSDQGTEEVLTQYRTIIRQHVADKDGSEVKSMRDGYMLAFPSPSRALQCAIAIQRAFVDYNYTHPEEPVRVRMGLDAGDASIEGEDQLSNNLILAARIADQAQGGRILISSQLKEITENSGEFKFDGGREVQLTGLPDTHYVYEVMWRREGDATGDSIRFFG